MKRIFLCGVALAIAILGMATIIYSWFTMSTTPRAGDFSLKASSLIGLEIALDTRIQSGDFNENLDNLGNFSRLLYKSYISGEEINNHLIAKYGSNFALIPSQGTGTTGFGRGKGFLDRNGDDNSASLILGERQFIEFTIYFRAEAVYAYDKPNIMLDLENYSTDPASDDYRSYAKGGASNSYTLPTEWVGTSYSLVNTRLGIEDYIVLGENNKILGINMPKYHDSENDDGVYVDPKTGNFCTYIPRLSFTSLDASFAGERIWTDVTAQTILDASGVMQAIGGRVDLTSLGLGSFINTYYSETAAGAVVLSGIGSSPVSVYGSTADALRLSFSKIDNSSQNLESFNHRVDSLLSEDALIWNPNSDTGKANDDTIANNFALHMLLATDGIDLEETENVDTYLGTHKNSQAMKNEVLLSFDTSNGVYHDDYVYCAATIRIWIEGWDAECLNTIMQTIASVSLQFRLSSDT